MIESKEHEEDLIEFAEKLRYKAQSFPKNEMGMPTKTYLEYISMMYDAEIIKIVLEIDVFPKMTSVLKLSKKIGMDKKELLNKLDDTIKRGFITKMGPQLSLPSPLFVYDIPFILEENYSREDVVKFAQLSRKFYTDDKYYKIWENKRDGTPRMRVVTVSEMVEPDQYIQPIEEIYKIIDQHENFALIPCPCRQRAEVEGIRECKDKYPIHNCILFDMYAKAVASLGDPNVKEVSKEHVKKITREAAEIGLVHMTDNYANNTTILCACCECCCGMLKGLTKLDNPRAVAKANFISVIDEDTCVACGTCLTRCKFGAITINNVAKVEISKCLGCGLCAVTCPEDAITMKRMEREPIPELKKKKSAIQ